MGKERHLSLARVLQRAGVSRTAFYSLARRESVFPKTIRSLARTLGVSPVQILERSVPEMDDALARRLDRARKICAEAPGAEFQNIWHVLILLEQSPVERLNRSLLRGRTDDIHG